MTNSFYSHGKLLITGEYAVLDGAVCLALPTKKGQLLQIEKQPNENLLVWKSFDYEGAVWFETEIMIDSVTSTLSTKKSTEGLPNETRQQTETLLSILNTALRLNPSFLKNLEGSQVITKLEFPRNWGLGSSSTFINNLAQWAQIDAFKLLWGGFTGSGYDIACAQHDTPILYSVQDQKPAITVVEFEPSFKNQLYFVHLNEKQNSREGISLYQSRVFNQAELVQSINHLTEAIRTAINLSEFEKLLHQHEEIMGNILGLTPVKRRLFNEYQGAIKSLGAWGGDFIMVTGDEASKNYFRKRGYHSIIDFDTMML